VISLKELHGADAWRYLMESVTDGQGDLRELIAVTRYYTEAGTPPGRWVGAGLAGLGRGTGPAANSLVSGAQMDVLFGQGRDPVTGDKLGRGYRHPPTYEQRVAARVRALPGNLTGGQRTVAVEKIREEERLRRVRRPVVGFDYVFSPPKSVSVLWAVADQATREQITAAHHAAVRDILTLIERDVARTRIGSDGVAQVRVRGIVAAAFDHYDSREHDPQLHTHVVVANRVQAADGAWRTLDSRGAIFPSVVALSETYDTLLADQLTRRLGVDWEVRDPGRKQKNAKWEIAGVPAALIEHFSTRRDQIEQAKDRLVAAWRERTGRDPDDATVLRLRQRANRETRQAKALYPLAVLVEHWQQRATAVLGGRDPATLMRRVWAAARRQRVMCADDFVGERLDAVVAEVFVRLHETRSTWTRWNILAETARATMRYRMASTADRLAVHERVATAVRDRSVLLTAPPLAITPEAFRRTDGSSQFQHEYAAVYTSRTLLDAEARLLDAARSVTGPRVSAEAVQRMLAADSADTAPLGEDQAAAVHAVTTSGRCVDVLVGPAGSGKTSALAAIRAVWEAAHGPGSVVGVAPTAKAAEILAGALGVDTDNTAKWLTEAALAPARRRRLRLLLDQADRLQTVGRQRAAARTLRDAAAVREQIRRWELRPDQLLVVDEASMTGTLALDALAAQARTVGAKVLLVGDWAQLSAVESGGAFRLLVHDRGDVPELSTVRRFSEPWERTASVRLRVGDIRAVDTYAEHGRIHGGAAPDMLTAAYAEWAADEHAGHVSLLIADTNTAVAELNTRARADRVAWGIVEPDGVRLDDGTHAGVGDRVVTRRIDRSLRLGPHSWVKNGDRWWVARRHGDGSLDVRRAGDATEGPVLRLPGWYVAQHVELAYATTAHRAQGDTVDTAHAVVRPEMCRELLYVAMTRARHANTAYVCTDSGIDDEHGPVDELTVHEVLEKVLARSGAEVSAHETLRAEQDKAVSIAQLAAEYDTIAREARRERWAALAALSFPTLGLDEVARSPEWPGLVAAWRRAEAGGLDLDAAAAQLGRAVASGVDPIVVVRDRVRRWYDVAAPEQLPERRLIAGLIPAADHVGDPEMREALDERAALIEQRADALVAHALTRGEPWIRLLGDPPDSPEGRLQWERAAATVAAYRDRHSVTDRADLFGEPHGGGQWTRRADRRRAQAAADDARRRSQWNGTRDSRSPADGLADRAYVPEL